MCLAFCTLYVERGATPALHLRGGGGGGRGAGANHLHSTPNSTQFLRTERGNERRSLPHLQTAISDLYATPQMASGLRHCHYWIAVKELKWNYNKTGVSSINRVSSS